MVTQNITPKDKRGKSIGSRHNIIPGEICVKIKEFIERFDAKEIHYSNNTTKKYLPSTLNIKLMYEMFIKINLNLNPTVKYGFFCQYFKQNFDLSFGRPQIDVCSTCEQLKIKVSDPHLNENAKRVSIAELIIHKRRASKFFKKCDEVRKLCKEQDNILGITIDYMQNLPLPHIPVQEVFYMRQLWIYEFCVHNLKTEKAVFYSYQEGEAYKGPNEVCTFLKMYIDKYIPATVNELYIFSDGCPGQNRNHTVVRFLMALASSKRLKKIEHIFPIRGHSFNVCDRDFATVKRKIRKQDRIYTHDDYIELIQQSSNTNKFSVEKVKTEEIIDYKKWWPDFYKKNVLSITSHGKKVPKAQKVTLKITDYFHFIYDSSEPGILLVHPYIDNFISERFSLAKPRQFRPDLPNIIDFKAYDQKLPINYKKMDNIKSLLCHIPADKMSFYDELMHWPITEAQEHHEEDY
ncbi:hypothetical protein QTP88_009502 [Uroleucon formosanum]